MHEVTSIHPGRAADASTSTESGGRRGREQRRNSCEERSVSRWSRRWRGEAQVVFAGPSRSPRPASSMKWRLIKQNHGTTSGAEPFLLEVAQGWGLPAGLVPRPTCLQKHGCRMDGVSGRGTASEAVGKPHRTHAENHEQGANPYFINLFRKW